MNWRANAEMDSEDPGLLGEDEDGNLWVPGHRRDGTWERRFDPRRPWHWRCWLRSRRHGRVAMIETVRRQPLSVEKHQSGIGVVGEGNR